jgi:hypothetical protein
MAADTPMAGAPRKDVSFFKRELGLVEEADAGVGPFKCGDHSRQFINF